MDGESSQVELTIGDDDTAGVTVTPKQTDTTTSESEIGNTLTYTVKLDSKPTDVVQVYFGSNDNTEALLGTSKSNKVELEADTAKSLINSPIAKMPSSSMAMVLAKRLPRN